MKSIKQQLNELVEGLHDGTLALNNWESGFVESVNEQLQNANGDTRKLSPNQVEKIDELYTQYCDGNGS